LLGLGVDDAFVLSAEFNRARKKDGKPTSVEERTVEAARYSIVHPFAVVASILRHVPSHSNS
jgi:hypothetical protein